ncbi:orotate phosphoribosyltransferase [bacterium]|nr:orotate phosphoribosyltransferase [bacterium]
MSLNRLKEILLKLSYEKREVTLASGRKSDFYFDGKQTALNAEGAALLGEFFFKKMLESYPQAQAVGGPTLGADPLVTAISIQSFKMGKPIPAFIIRKEPKKHGTGAWIEGIKNLSAGMNVVIVEDVVTSGGSLYTAVEKAQDFGLKVTGALCIVDREEGGREFLAGKGVPLQCLFTKTELLK